MTKYNPADVVAMVPGASTLVGVPSNPALAFSGVVHEAAPNPVVIPELVYCSEPVDISGAVHEAVVDPVIIPEPVHCSDPVSINPPRRSSRRTHTHGRR